MPENDKSQSGRRTRIPASIERQILTEAGHRCAVCGDASPLERAHIIPWRQSHEHRAEDLICLCANCHRRADAERWGERTLRHYKANPWIRKRNKDEDTRAPSEEIRLTIDMRLEEFDSRQRRLLIFALASFLDLDPEDISISKIEAGSVNIIVDMPRASADRLQNAFESRDRQAESIFGRLRITAIEFLRGETEIDLDNLLPLAEGIEPFMECALEELDDTDYNLITSAYSLPFPPRSLSAEPYESETAQGRALKAARLRFGRVLERMLEES